MKPEVQQNKEFAQWLGEWITRASKRVTGLNNFRTSWEAPEQSALPSAASNQMNLSQ
jgi:hypothetical protein